MREINSTTKLYALIGHPIAHSNSPHIHNNAFEYFNINAVYLGFDILPENLADAIYGFKAIGVKGFNVTIPHKQNIVKYLDEIDVNARLIGAVNTVKNEDGYLKGYNTDGTGFIKTLKKNNIYVNDAIVLGAGGAARAICVSLSLNGIKKLNILNRSLDKAKALGDYISSINTDCVINVDTLDNIRDYSADLLVNTTSVGMWPNVDKSPVNKIPDDVKYVYDIVYNPHETRLLKMAQDSGCHVIHGIEMLISQAVESFRIWTGLEIQFDFISSLKLTKN